MSGNSKPETRNPSSPQAKIVIDGREHAADPSRNLLEVALELGYDLPYFCWHPALGSVGACRQCAVTQYKDDEDQTGKLVMACMTPCGDKTRFALESAEAREMREAVVEFLMTNHPHDCPVCEEGGHCHLQDMTVMTGHAYRRYRHLKRTHRNQDLGPFVSHEMNRCIACYRCTRFYREYAGGDDLDVFGPHNHVYFGRAQDGTLESPFAGNLTEVCPTGVFTDKTHGEHYTRKWDLQSAPGVCAHCAVGCNVLPGERYGMIRRVENRYHGQLNGYFLCDRGRYGYGYVNDAVRPQSALIRPYGPPSPEGSRHENHPSLPGRGAGGEGAVATLPAADAILHLAEILKAGKLAGVGSPRATLEANHALRALVGEANFYRGEAANAAALSDLIAQLLQQAPVAIASVRDCERADAALVLGEDVDANGARLALALRQMTRQRSFELARDNKVPVWQDQSVRLLAQSVRSPLYLATASACSLDAIAVEPYRGTPAAIARLGTAVAHALDLAAPSPPGLSKREAALAQDIARDLKAAERPLLVSGAGSASLAVLRAAGAIAQAFFKATQRQLQLALLPAECNSLGAALLGGDTLDALLARIEAGEIETLIVCENDLYRRTERARIDAALARLKQLVVLDALATDTTRAASLSLPAGSVFETDGTLVNFEGRAQRSFQVFVPDSDRRESWRWLQQAALAAGQDLGDGLDALTRGCAAAVPALAGILDAAPNAAFRVHGARVPRQPPRYSGRTAMHAQRDIHEHRPPQDPDSALAYSMEGAPVQSDRPVALHTLTWWPRWNSPQALTRFQQEIGGELRGGDPGVRLLTPDGSYKAAYPESRAPEDRLRAVPLHHLFGSEELSNAAPVMAQRGLAAPYLALHPHTAARLHLSADAEVTAQIGELSLTLPLQLREDLHEDAAGLPVGVPGMPVFAAGATVTIV